MTKARTIINDALLAFGGIGEGQTMRAEDAQFALRNLNRMLGSWSNQPLLIVALREGTLTFVAGTPSYSTSLLSTGRPVRIVSAFVRAGGLDYPIDTSIPKDEFDLIPQKTLTGIPEICYVDADAPDSVLWPYPVPNDAYVMHVTGSYVIGENLTLDDDIVLPPGYEDGIVDGLAVKLAPRWGKVCPPPIVDSANEARAWIKRMNFVPGTLGVDLPVNNGAVSSVQRIKRGY